MPNQLLLGKLGTIVQYHRKKSGLNRRELALLANVGKTAIFDIEHSKQTIRVDTLIKVLDVLNISLVLNSPLMATYQAEEKNENR